MRANTFRVKKNSLSRQPVDSSKAIPQLKLFLVCRSIIAIDHCVLPFFFMSSSLEASGGLCFVIVAFPG